MICTWSRVVADHSRCALKVQIGLHCMLPICIGVALRSACTTIEAYDGVSWFQIDWPLLGGSCGAGRVRRPLTSLVTQLVLLHSRAHHVLSHWRFLDRIKKSDYNNLRSFNLCRFSTYGVLGFWGFGVLG